MMPTHPPNEPAGAMVNVPDVSEGFENVLYRTVREVRTLQEFFDAVNRLYAGALQANCRLRAAWHYANEQVKQLTTSHEGSYIRVLGFQRKASLISEEKDRLTDSATATGRIARMRYLKPTLSAADICRLRTGFYRGQTDRSGAVVL